MRELKLDELASLRMLTAAQLQEVLDDLNLQLAGTKIIFCIDPHEIYDFCFPIDPAQTRSTDINTVADDQIALYEVFYNVTEPPLLLPEYRRELDSLTSFLRYTVDRAYSSTDILKSFVDEARLQNVPDVAIDNDIELDPRITENLNVYVAIALGVFRLGLDRYLDVVSHRLQLTPKDDAVITAFANYEKTDVAERVYERLERSIRVFAPSGGTFRQADIMRQLRSAQYDAGATDRMLSANAALTRGRETPPHLLLYLSSAHRTQVIFRHPAVVQALPQVNGRPYRIWRTRAQLFAYAVSKGEPTDRDARIGNAIRYLEKARDVLKEVEQIGTPRACDDCILTTGGGESCERLESCRALAALGGEIKRRREEMFNLGLVGALRNYNEVFSKSKPKQESVRLILELLKNLSTDTTRQTLSQRVSEVRTLISIKTNFATALSRGLAEWATMLTTAGPRPFLRQGRDVIASAAQYLPTRPILTDPRYRALADEIIAFFKRPAFDQRQRVSDIEKPYHEFLDHDSKMKMLTGEHELVRCLLYLALPDKRADILAFNHAKTMLRRFDSPQLRREYLYIAGWAARRARKYPSAHRSMQMGARMDPNDPRFPHGRCLNTFAWHTDTTTRRRCPHRLSTAVADAQRAIDLYIQTDEQANADLIGACFNNLAFLHAYDPEDSSLFDIVKARFAVDALKKYVPPDEWSQMYPEYFHTEATVELHEARVARDRGEIEHARSKLLWASRAIDAALDLYLDDDFKSLKIAIEAAMSDLLALAEKAVPIARDGPSSAL